MNKNGYKRTQVGWVIIVKLGLASWLVGWGIRWTGSGWLFNVSGLDAVELSLKSGRRFRIGTDDPRGLHTFIIQHLEATI